MAMRPGGSSSTIVLPQLPVLRLRADTTTTLEPRRVQWEGDVVDNEGLGRKKSKRCCIFHKKKSLDDSSSDSSSNSDSSHSIGSGRTDARIPTPHASGFLDDRPVAEASSSASAPSRQVRATRRRKPGSEREPTPVLDPEHCDHCRYLQALEARAQAASAAVEDY